MVHLGIVLLWITSLRKLKVNQSGIFLYLKVGKDSVDEALSL